MYNLGTCESFFLFESNLESNRPSDSFSNRIFESNRPYTTQAVTEYRRTVQPVTGLYMLTTSIVNMCVVFNSSVFCIYDEREWCTAYGTPNWVFVYFNSVIKRVKQCCCTLILLPKSTLNAKFNLKLKPSRQFFLSGYIAIFSRVIVKTLSKYPKVNTVGFTSLTFGQIFQVNTYYGKYPVNNLPGIYLGIYQVNTRR